MPRPRIPRRRERILDAAEALIREHGFAGMSMSGLARRCGVGKGALYLEFAGKRALVDRLVARATGRVAAEVRAAIDAGRVAGLGDLYRVTADALLRDDLLTAAYLDDAGVLGDHVAARGGDRYRRRFAWLDAYVRLLQRDGSADPGLDPGALSLALAAFTVGLLSLATVAGPVDRDRLGAAIRTFATLVDRGVTPGAAPSALSPEATAGLHDLIDRIGADNAPEEA